VEEKRRWPEEERERGGGGGGEGEVKDEKGEMKQKDGEPAGLAYIPPRLPPAHHIYPLFDF
jgi:hypothetical protein